MSFDHNKFILITGGRRSGKSSYALSLAEAIGPTRLYIATAEALDDEMKDRIARHRKERGDEWETIEEPVDVADIVRESRRHDVVLVDCFTLWLCNLMHIREGDSPAFTEDASHHRIGTVPDEEILAQIDDLAAACRDSTVPVIAVTNELGLGVIPGDPLSRRYTDLAGIMNQRMAESADRVVMVVSGIPMILKECA